MPDTPNSHNVAPGPPRPGVNAQAMVVAPPVTQSSALAPVKAVLWEPGSLRRRAGTLFIIALGLVILGEPFWSGVAQSIVASIVGILVEGVGARRERQAALDAAAREQSSQRIATRQRERETDKLKNAIREALRDLPELTGSTLAKIGQNNNLPAEDTFQVLAKVTQARETLKQALGRLEGRAPSGTAEIDLPPPARETP